MCPAMAHEWMNLASIRSEPTPTIRSCALTMTIVKYESLRLRSHSKRSVRGKVSRVQGQGVVPRYFCLEISPTVVRTARTSRTPRS